MYSVFNFPFKKKTKKLLEISGLLFFEKVTCLIQIKYYPMFILLRNKCPENIN